MHNLDSKYKKGTTYFIFCMWLRNLSYTLCSQIFFLRTFTMTGMRYMNLNSTHQLFSIIYTLGCLLQTSCIAFYSNSKRLYIERVHRVIKVNVHFVNFRLQFLLG